MSQKGLKVSERQIQRAARDNVLGYGEAAIKHLEDKAAGQMKADTPPHIRFTKIKKCFQRTVRNELVKRVKVHASVRMRCKLQRWNLQGLPGRTAERYLRHLDILKKYLPPRVSAAALRTAWNGWCTHRRFQKHRNCIFACNSFFQEDSIEHYAGCQIGVGWLRSKLHFDGPISKGHLIVLGAQLPSITVEDILRLGLWGYVLYKAFNFLRTSNRQLDPSDVEGLFTQYLLEATSGHEGACRFVENCWRQDYRHAATQVEQDEQDQDAELL